MTKLEECCPWKHSLKAILYNFLPVAEDCLIILYISQGVFFLDLIAVRKCLNAFWSSESLHQTWYYCKSDHCVVSFVHWPHKLRSTLGNPEKKNTHQMQHLLRLTIRDAAPERHQVRPESLEPFKRNPLTHQVRWKTKTMPYEIGFPMILTSGAFLTINLINKPAMNYRRILIAAVFILYIQWKKTVKNGTSWRHKTLSASAIKKQETRTKTNQ